MLKYFRTIGHVRKLNAQKIFTANYQSNKKYTLPSPLLPLAIVARLLPVVSAFVLTSRSQNAQRQLKKNRQQTNELHVPEQGQGGTGARSTHVEPLASQQKLIKIADRSKSVRKVASSRVTTARSVSLLLYSRHEHTKRTCGNSNC